VRLRLLLLAVVTLVTAVVVAVPTAAEDEGAGCTPDTRVRRDVPYGPAARQRVDVFPAAADACGETPVLVWVHGGGWVKGDKARLAAKRAWARDHGWTLVSVNYRLTDLDDPPAERLRYPAHNRDVARAVTWVVDHIGPLGGDPGRVALAGHSAGAQIVSSVGTMQRYLAVDVRPSLCGVVSLDTDGYDVARRIRRGDRGSRLYRAVFGNDPRTWVDASPINHTDGADPAELVVRRGAAVRQQGQARFAASLREAGVPTTVVRTPGYSHGDVNRLLGDPTDDVLTPRVEAFLNACFEA